MIFFLCMEREEHHKPKALLGSMQPSHQMQNGSEHLKHTGNLIAELKIIFCCEVKDLIEQQWPG